MRTIDFKAEIRDIEAARRQCGLIGATREGTVAQIDVCFRVPSGRLKRRETPGRPVEWIVFSRPDRLGARVSTYTLLTDEQARVRFGEGTLAPARIVRKTREVWRLDNLRIHLDEVEDVGRFVEFQAIVDAEHDLDGCSALVVQLREQFEPILGEPVGGSYESLVAECEGEMATRRFP